MIAQRIFNQYCLITIALLTVFLAGCATVSPQTLGIPQSEWDQYSPEKKDQILASYQQAQERKRAVSAKAGKGVLTVNIEGGQVLLPPYTHLTAYQPISFTLKQGDCNKKITVAQADDPEQKGKLSVCYQGDTLYIDPSPYEPNLSLGALQFPYMPIWKRGFTYPNMTSSGLLKLTNVDISLKQVVSAGEDN